MLPHQSKAEVYLYLQCICNDCNLPIDEHSLLFVQLYFAASEKGRYFMWRCACLDVFAQTITHSVRALDDVISHPYEARRDVEQKKNNAFRAERLQASQSPYVPSFDPRSRFGSTARSTPAFYLTRLLLDLYVCVKHPGSGRFCPSHYWPLWGPVEGPLDQSTSPTLFWPLGGFERGGSVCVCVG